MNCEPNTQIKRFGFSVVELLMVVAVVSAVSAGAIVALSNTAATGVTKLHRDVAVVNSAIRTYLLSGGTFLEADMRNPGTVLAKLKTRASDASAKELAGLRGSMIDAGLTYEVQSAEDAATGVERARFIADPRNPRFVVERSGPPGIRQFVRNSEVAAQDFGTEDRTVTMELAKSDPWVWDYQPSGLPARRPVNVPMVASVASSAPSASADALPLNPPTFSVNSGSFPLLQFDMPITLSNPNLANTASILYSINGGEFVPYTGQPIYVAPGTSLAAYSTSNDADDWADSTSVSQLYNANVVPLGLALSVPQAVVTYASAGGAMIPGSSPGPALATPPVLNVTNLNQIPVSYQNSGTFVLRWTYDGSQPFGSPTAVTGSNFTGGFSPQSVPVALPHWQGGTTLSINAVAQSLNPNAVRDSQVVSGTLTMSPMALRIPDITPSAVSDTVTISPQTSYGDTPAGYRIYYTLDGTEPAALNGEPVNGTLYTGPIEVPRKLFAHTDIKARVFGPAEHAQWFTPSPVAGVIKHSKATVSEGYAFLEAYHNAGLCGYTWNVLGLSSEVSGSGAIITGSIAVGPLASVDFDVFSHPGTIAKDPLGFVTGPANFSLANITPIRNAAMDLSIAAGQLRPTQIYDEINASTKIDASASDGMNIIRIRSIKIASSDTLTFRGGPSDFFIVNVTETLEVTGGALIQLSGGLQLDGVLINSPNGADVKLTGGAGIMSITYLAPRSKVDLGGSSTFTGSIFSGTDSRVYGNPQLVGGSPFGECEDCCD
jgi:choice-of-anchor A domain-containing protein